MSLAASLEFLGYELDVDFIALDDAGHEYVQWLSSKPRPTDAQIAAAALPAAKAAKKREIKEAARQRILSQYPDWLQVNLLAQAMEILSEGRNKGPEWTKLQGNWAWIKAQRGRSDLLEADVDNCTTVEAVEQLTIGGWPQ